MQYSGRPVLLETPRDFPDGPLPAPLEDDRRAGLAWPVGQSEGLDDDDSDEEEFDEEDFDDDFDDDFEEEEDDGYEGGVAPNPKGLDDEFDRNLDDV